MPEENKIKHLIFGGSFDPPHIGHMLKAQYARKIIGAQEIIFMLAYQHPWGKELIDWEHRQKMLNHSINDIGMKDCYVSCFEVGFPGRSTYEILLKLFEWENDLNTDNTSYLIG